MDTIVTCKSKNNNFYTFNRDKKYISITHPLMIDYLSNKDELISDEEMVFYSNKIDYLKNYGYFDTEEKLVDGYITKESIINEICNLKQLVFEVTDSCNLQCKYCGYGDYYANYDTRKRKMMNPEFAKKFIDYLVNMWSLSESNSYVKTINIGFYGGEPLLNMMFIKNIVEYVKYELVLNLSFMPEYISA